MPSTYSPSSPEQEEIQLLLPDAADGPLTISNFTEYSFNSHFLTPTDGFSFSIGDERLSDEQRDALKAGVRVQLLLNGNVQSTGYIDSVASSASRDSGSVWRIEGRDSFAQACDTCADPTVALKEGQTLAEALKTIFAPFGWEKAEQFVISNDADLDVRSNAFRAKRNTSDGKGFSRRALKEYKVHRTRPYPRESAFEFAARITQRFGLWLWTSSDGTEIIVSPANTFNKDAPFKIYRNKSNGLDGKPQTNVLDGTVTLSVAEQPTAIIADSYSRGGEFGPGRVKTIFLNAAVRVADSELIKNKPPYQKYIDSGATVLKLQEFPFENVMEVPKHRILYLHDDESATQEHLENYVRREMALLQRKSLTANFTVEGHGQFSKDGQFLVWTPDMTVEVEDEVSGLHEILYILSRTFNKSRSGGTTTSLELIRLGTLVFSDPETGKKPTI